jgi:hypothetical protein
VQHLEGAASRGGEQIDDGLDRFVGMVIGRFELAVGSVLGLGLMDEVRYVQRCAAKPNPRFWTFLHSLYARARG